MKTVKKFYDLTQSDTITLTNEQLEDLAFRVVQQVLKEQIDFFAETHPSRTQTANNETLTALLELEASRHVKH